MSKIETIPGRIFQYVQANPSRICIFFRDLDAQDDNSDQEISYAQLWSRASQLASHLDFVQEGNHIMIVMPLCIDLLATHLAIMLRGGVPSIFAHPSPKITNDVYAAKLHHSFEAMHPQAVITTKEFSTSVKGAARNFKLQIFIPPELGLTSTEINRNWIECATVSTAVIQFSSGSTGLQKAVALSHEMIIQQCDSYANAIKLNQKHDKICSWLPLYHDMGLFTSWLMPVLHGIPIALIDPFQWVKQPLSIFRLIKDTGGTLCWLPNFAFTLLTQRAGVENLDKLDIASMRGFINCSEPVSGASLQHFQSKFEKIGVRPSSLWTCYAMAENSFAVSSASEGLAMSEAVRLDRDELSKGNINICDDGILIVSCGKPIEGTTVAVVDAIEGVEIPGRIGEIIINSPYMLKNYYRASETTRAPIDPDGWYHSGDLGFLHKGSIYVTGRKKDLLIVGGRNIYPQDIEAICDQMKGAIPGRSAALGMMNDNSGTEKVILILETVLTDDAEKGALMSNIRKAAIEQLDCTIADIRLVPQMWLMKTSSGKIARQLNLDKYVKEFLGNVGSVYKELPAPALSTNWGSLLAWCLLFSIVLYLVILVQSMGTNTSWNVYMRF